MPEQDWFAQNAPKATPHPVAAGEDWFAANAPHEGITNLTQDQAIESLRRLSEDKQREVLKRLTPDARKSLLSKLKGNAGHPWASENPQIRCVSAG